LSQATVCGERLESGGIHLGCSGVLGVLGLCCGRCGRCVPDLRILLFEPLRVIVAEVRRFVGVVGAAGCLRFGVRGSSELTMRVSLFVDKFRSVRHLRSTAESLCSAALLRFELVRADMVSDIVDVENGM